MPTFNIGSDCQVVVNGPFGEIELDNETQFSADPVSQILSVDKLDGTVEGRTVHRNWKGTISTIRSDSTVDDLAQKISDSIRTGVPVPNGSIQQVVHNVGDGTSSTYLFTDVSFNVTALGDYQNSKEVRQGIAWQAKSRSVA